MQYSIKLPLLLVFCAVACSHEMAHIDVATQPAVNPWTSLKLHNDPGNFQFAIVTDRTGGHRPGIFEDAVRKLNLLQPEFVMSVGDLIEGYSDDEVQIDRAWDEFQSFTARLAMPFFFVPGNHDLSNEMQLGKWKERFGRTYYHFVYRDVLFLCLNSEDPPFGRMSDQQVEYVRKALEENPDVRWTLVFFHRPIWIQPIAEEPGGDGWLKIEELLKDRPYTVFAGHFHTYTKHVRNDRRFIVLASTGGASQLRGPDFGEFDHLAWVTMTDDGPLIANLMLSGIWDENVTTVQSKQMVSALIKAARIVAQPVRSDSDTFTAADVEMKLINDADHPLKVTGHFRRHDLLRPDPHAIEEIIEPNSVRVIDLKMEARKPTAVGEVQPLVMELDLSYELPDGPKLQMQRVQAIAVDRLYPIPLRDTPVLVDGKLDDWKQLPITVNRPSQTVGDTLSWKGETDASFLFAVEHDEQNLYIAVETIDDRIVSQAGKDPWEQDGIEVRVDARPEPARSNGRGDADSGNHFFIAASPVESAEKVELFQREKLPPDVQAVCIRSERGYVTEISIPAAHLTKIQRRPWEQIRVNIAVNDLDDPTGEPAQLWWRPDWRSDENYVGSGTLQRE